MVDAPRSGIIIFSVVFLAFFAIIVNAIPAFMIVTDDPTGRIEHEVDTWFTQDEIQALGTTNQTSPPGGTFTVIDWGVAEGFGHDMRFVARHSFTPYEWYNYQTFPLQPLFYLWNEHYMDWYNINGTSRGGVLQDNELVNDLVASDNDTIAMARYKMKCDDFYLITLVGYNMSAYPLNLTGLRSACSAGDLHFEFGIDEAGIGKTHIMNAWNLIGALLFFQMPTVFNDASLIYINTLISIPLWIAIGIITFRILLAIADVIVPF